MKINRGTINNINKKLLASAVVFSIATTALTGCAKTTAYFEYTTNEQGESICNNVMKYSNIKNDDYKIIWIMNDSDITIHITKKERAGYFSNGQEYFYYYDIFGTDVVYSNYSTKTTLLREVNFEDYLINYDKVQEEYTEEEMQQILQDIKIEYEQVVNKELVKEK